jgi:hypothetical protein
LNSLEGSLISVFQENWPELILYKSDIHPTMVLVLGGYEKQEHTPRSYKG